MKLSLRTAFFAALLSTLSCAATQAPVRPWRVWLETTGGIAGKGAGTISIASDEKIEVTTQMGKSCSYTAIHQELEQYDRMLAAAHPENWKESYVPENACCDRFEYTLNVEIAGRKYATKWLDDAELPPDLKTIGLSTNALRGKYAAKCQ